LETPKKSITYFNIRTILWISSYSLRLLNRDIGHDHISDNKAPFPLWSSEIRPIKLYRQQQNEIRGWKIRRSAMPPKAWQTNTFSA